MMASTKKPNYSAKVKYWADGVTGECSGGIIGCIDMLFTALPIDKRERVLALLAESHTSKVKWENERASKNAA
ncbi:hypothetical protein AAEY46_004415 [Yersinia enterocolitica]|nr:hypothetical protein [Yersinia enterocolitica]